MERVPPIRRRQQARPLTVGELLERTGTPVQDDAAARHAAEPDDAEPAAAPASADGRFRALANAGRAAGIGVGVLALCGAVGAASVITARHHPSTASAAVRQASVITGAHALRPDEVAASLPGAHSSASTTGPAPTATPTTTPHRPRGHAAAGNPPSTTNSHHSASEPSTTQPTTAARSATAPASATAAQPTTRAEQPTDVVSRFYRLLGSKPSSAAKLLNPRLLGSGMPDFVDAWRHTRDIHVESVAQRSRDTVEAVVRVLSPDGSWLQLHQLVTLSGGDGQGRLPVIEHVKLLSAQRG